MWLFPINRFVLDHNSTKLRQQKSADVNYIPEVTAKTLLVVEINRQYKTDSSKLSLLLQ